MEIEKRVREELPSALLNRGIIHHAKHAFRAGCSCTYCELKREASYSISFTRPTREDLQLFCGDYGDAIKNARWRKRMRYRGLLRLLRNEELHNDESRGEKP